LVAFLAAFLGAAFLAAFVVFLAAAEARFTFFLAAVDFFAEDLPDLDFPVIMLKKLITSFSCVLSVYYQGIVFAMTLVRSSGQVAQQLSLQCKVNIIHFTETRYVHKMSVHSFLFAPVHVHFSFHRVAPDFSIVHKTRHKCTNTDQKKRLYVKKFSKHAKLIFAHEKISTPLSSYIRILNPGFGGSAFFTTSCLPSHSVSFNASMARCASSAFGIDTKPYFFDSPVTRSYTMRALSTRPNLANKDSSITSLTRDESLATKIFIDISLSVFPFFTEQRFRQQQ
jgi:hypothetical protein